MSSRPETCAEPSGSATSEPRRDGGGRERHTALTLAAPALALAGRRDGPVLFARRSGGWWPVPSGRYGPGVGTHPSRLGRRAAVCRSSDQLAAHGGTLMTDLQVAASVVVDDPRLLDLLDADASVEWLGGGAGWSEGPLYLPGSDAVIWSDIPGRRVLRWTAATGEVTIEREDVPYPNGRAVDGQGRVVECSHGERAVLRLEADGSTTVLAAMWQGRRLNSPNDVVVRSDGSVWFTDPAYGITTPGFGDPGEREYGDHWVFRVDPADGQVNVVVTDVEDPNGLAFSPDETVLYVSDTSASGAPAGAGNHHIRAYDVVDGLRCKNGRVVAEVGPGVPDGFRVDALGHIWTSSQDSVQVFAPDGIRLGKVPVPETVTNVCFGGTDGTTLFIATATSLYRLVTTVRGAGR